MGVCCVRGFINILTSAVMYFHVWRCMKKYRKIILSAYGLSLYTQTWEPQKMLNIYKWLMKNRTNLFSIEASFGCTALVFEVMLVASFNKGFVFFVWMESLTTDWIVQLRSPEAWNVQGRSDFRQGFIAIFFMSWSRPRHYSFVLLFQIGTVRACAWGLKRASGRLPVLSTAPV